MGAPLKNPFHFWLALFRLPVRVLHAVRPLQRCQKAHATQLRLNSWRLVPKKNKLCQIPKEVFRGALELLNEINAAHEIVDERNSGKAIRTKFLGTLSKDQKPAVKALLAHDTGILSAATGFGKPVLAPHVIAKRKRNTLILVHRKQLRGQWIARLQTFLALDYIDIGQIGGGKRKPQVRLILH